MLLRMSDAKSEAARELSRSRWGPTRVVGAADVVIARAAELPDDKRDELLAALAVREGDDDE